MCGIILFVYLCVIITNVVDYCKRSMLYIASQADMKNDVDKPTTN